ncbi:OmpW family protein [Novosphingobium sp. FSW06-99]|uniref:OmpW/AlkL family protein n=1 Tax=Novosphingobium sp. FSW06-99 TaxID=1739113 RepID=UPI00076C32B0|nr:OmpW family outer membrane protein [Novosphingobium sp. FSW06-99]KUR74056.1 hypothetical protein AQZ49_19125 [Novosphingobium sp. FSW06-99]
MKTFVRRTLAMCLVAPVLAAAAPAFADDAAAGPWQVKLFYTAVIPDGKISKVEQTTLTGPLVSAPQTYASDNAFTPTLAVEYFFTPNVSVETIAGVTAHHVGGAGSLAGTALIDHVLIVPATLTVKYHLPLGPIKPYVGVGPTWFIVGGERPGADALALGVTRTKLSSDVGVAVQAGVDIPIGKSPYSLSFDAKKYWVDTTANFYAGSADVLTTKNKLDPWVLSAGVAYRF